MVLLCREPEQEDEGTFELEECKLYLCSGKLVWGMAKACLLFRDIIIFAGDPASASSF